MAIQTQTIYRRVMTQLDSPSFKHKEQKYKLAGWNTSREEANKGIVLPQYSQPLSVDNYTSCIELYAVWKLRDIVVSYSDLQIAADDTSFNSTSTNIWYKVTRISSYADTGVEVKREIEDNSTSPYAYYFAEGMNGEAGSETATVARTLTASYVHASSGLTATATFTQSGYTPTYKIACIASDGGEVQCWQNGRQLQPSAESGKVKTYSSSASNEFLLKAVPVKQSSRRWVAKRTCAYYKYPSKQILHKDRSSCGSWEYDTAISYSFVSWTGNGIDGSTQAETNVIGSASDSYPQFTAAFKMLPLLQNTVIGDWRKTWKTTYYTYRNVTKYKPVQKWVPTCFTDTNWWGKHEVYHHEGMSGHGYYVTVSTEPYVEQVKDTNYKTHTNQYITADSIAAPYTLTMPADGVLKISGKYGVNVYGDDDCKQVGGFKLLRYNESSKSYDDYLTFYASLDNASDMPFYKEINVQKNQMFQFTKCTSTDAKNHIAIYIDKIELDNVASVSVASDDANTSYQLFSQPCSVDDLTDAVVKQSLIYKYDIGDKIDHSVRVVRAGTMDRDQQYMPKYTMTYHAEQQQIVRICMAAGYGYGYVHKLEIRNAQAADKAKAVILKQIGTGTDWKYYSLVDITSFIKYVYMPENSDIEIIATWSTVDTEHFDVWLDVKSVQFTLL